MTVTPRYFTAAEARAYMCANEAEWRALLDRCVVTPVVDFVPGVSKRPKYSRAQIDAFCDAVDQGLADEVKPAALADTPQNRTAAAIALINAAPISSGRGRQRAR